MTLTMLLAFTVINCCIAQKFPTLKNQIKLSPMRTLDLVNPGYELSYERLLQRLFALQASAAYLKDIFKTTDFENIQGYRLGLEGKFLIAIMKVTRPYLAAEMIYQNSNLKFEGYY
ncbi:MAG: hypothetical protein J7604_20300 [Sporocytophaga sp.]|nr:hypothetical protein [Sporocytophaga sp.]